MNISEVKIKIRKWNWSLAWIKMAEFGVFLKESGKSKNKIKWNEMWILGEREN